MAADWHRVGLERPHFGTRFRAQCESWSLQPNQGNPVLVWPPAYSGYQFEYWQQCMWSRRKERGLVVVPNSSVERQWQRLTVRGEDGKNYALHVQTCQLLHPTLALRNLFSKICKDCPIQKSPHKKVRNGRERPHFLADDPPKSSVGSLPPGTQEE